MTKKQLVNNLRCYEGMTWEQATRVVNRIFDDISTAVADGEDVYIPKFGRFVTAKIATRHCKHPETKEDVFVPEHEIVRFRMSEEFRRKLKK